MTLQGPSRTTYDPAQSDLMRNKKENPFLFQMPRGEFNIGSDCPQKNKNALYRLDGKICAITRESDSMIQVCHIIPSSIGPAIMYAHELTVDASLHGAFDRLQWTFVPAQSTIDHLKSYIETHEQPEYHDFFNSEDSTIQAKWFAYEIATFPDLVRPIVIRKHPPTRLPAHHSEFDIYVPKLLQPDRLDTQSVYRDANGGILPTFYHHAHPYLVCLAASARYLQNADRLSPSQIQRHNSICEVLDAWLDKCKRIRDDEVDTDGESVLDGPDDPNPPSKESFFDNPFIDEGSSFDEPGSGGFPSSTSGAKRVSDSGADHGGKKRRVELNPNCNVDAVAEGPPTLPLQMAKLHPSNLLLLDMLQDAHDFEVIEDLNSDGASEACSCESHHGDPGRCDPHEDVDNDTPPLCGLHDGQDYVTHPVSVPTWLNSVKGTPGVIPSSSAALGNPSS
ncbi:hypothetical protein DACRYDRAFT_18916 [Dacryopinax primogenitus]|uniref:Uncharacterized protein n=1 Tax=Dacryopinax primogenitus (strain DJM 731) TaxID=1858805 RepID=M5G0A2_DACPD|nr:uncharacterized protein DACRYDRAFT_18916 [Dacryopinax primogenitus]EJT97207.1 hypothetical protein DACRYDRAFT_18916 [Dacryopinax primogenitus]